MTNGTQGKIGKIRPPRVQITYDVEIGGASKEKELPFVVGVIADLTAQGGDPEQRLRDRHFVEIDIENIDKVMTAMRPAVSVRVPNRLTGEGQRKVELEFLTMESFSPDAVAKSVPELAKLLETRVRLSDLLAKLEGNERLNDLLAEVVSNTEIQVQAQSEISLKKLPVPEAPADLLPTK
jgi:type VI secretion system protein ImpB